MKSIVFAKERSLPNDVYVVLGVCIGRGAVVAVRSNVFDDLPVGIVPAGMPAGKIRDRVSDRLSSADA